MFFLLAATVLLARRKRPASQLTGRARTLATCAFAGECVLMCVVMYVLVACIAKPGEDARFVWYGAIFLAHGLVQILYMRHVRD
jgi:hypothetical protein